MSRRDREGQKREAVECRGVQEMGGTSRDMMRRGNGVQAEEREGGEGPEDWAGEIGEVGEKRDEADVVA